MFARQGHVVENDLDLDLLRVDLSLARLPNVGRLAEELHPILPRQSFAAYSDKASDDIFHLFLVKQCFKARLGNVRRNVMKQLLVLLQRVALSIQEPNAATSIGEEGAQRGLDA